MMVSLHVTFFMMQNSLNSVLILSTSRDSSCKRVSKSCNYFLFQVLRFCCWLLSKCCIKTGKALSIGTRVHYSKITAEVNGSLYIEELFLFFWTVCLHFICRPELQLRLIFLKYDWESKNMS